MQAAAADGSRTVGAHYSSLRYRYLRLKTLNDRGTPVPSADLIKNHVFATGERLDADVDRWNEEYWRDLDEAGGASWSTKGVCTARGSTCSCSTG